MNALGLTMLHSIEYRTYKTTERVFVLQQMFLDGRKDLKYVLHGIVNHKRLTWVKQKNVSKQYGLTYSEAKYLVPR